MNANKRAAIFFAAAFVAAATGPAQAQVAAPAMYGVEEIVVQYARMGDSGVAQSCGLTREAIAEVLGKELAYEGVPAVAVASAKPPVVGKPRIDLVPEIFTVGNGGFDCTSWVSLSAQTQSTVRVPPVEILRNVVVTYWRAGLMIASSQTLHARDVDEGLKKLAQRFAQQYRLDQPPSLPDGKKDAK